MTKKRQLDGTDWKILEALQENARLSYAELGRKVGLSAPAVTERLRRLEEDGLVSGYQAIVDPSALGLNFHVFIDLATKPDRYAEVKAFLTSHPSIRSAYHVTGENSFRIEAIVECNSDLEPLIEKLSRFGHTHTSVALSSLIERHVIRSSV